MSWLSKRGKIDWAWIECRLLLRFEDEYETAEDLYVLCQWRKRGHTVDEQWKFAVFFRNKRIYALDIQPSAYHVNDKAGKGLPLFLQDFYGSHEHTWSADGEGYGYAEPFDTQNKSLEVIWRTFLKRAHIGISDFFHPDNNEPELI